MEWRFLVVRCFSSIPFARNHRGVECSRRVLASAPSSLRQRNLLFVVKNSRSAATRVWHPDDNAAHCHRCAREEVRAGSRKKTSKTTKDIRTGLLEFADEVGDTDDRHWDKDKINKQGKKFRKE